MALNDDTATAIQHLFAEQLGLPREKIALTSHCVNDLGMDSLDTVEMIMELEDLFDISIPDDAAEPLHTVQLVVDYIEKATEPDPGQGSIEADPNDTPVKVEVEGGLPVKLSPEVEKQLAEGIASDAMQDLLNPDPPEVNAEQLLVQLAGCSVIALGGTSPEQTAERGDYGWSPAYQDVRNLREHFDEAQAALEDITMYECACPALIKKDGTTPPCVHERAVTANNNIRNRMTKQGQG